MRLNAEELDLHGHTVDEALPRLEEFLYSAFQTGKRRVWIIHGKGTGVLKLEVRRYLAGHPLVGSHRTANGDRGGDGATEVDLSDR